MTRCSRRSAMPERAPGSDRPPGAPEADAELHVQARHRRAHGPSALDEILRELPPVADEPTTPDELRLRCLTASPWSTRKRAGRATTSSRKARKVLGSGRSGTAGTLDPDATGVLLLGVGRATRLLRFLTALSKTYTAEVVLGRETSTLDASASVDRHARHAASTHSRRCGRGGGAHRRRSCRCRRWSRP